MGKPTKIPSRSPASPTRRRDDVQVVAMRCPFCHEDVHPEAHAVGACVACERCLARHHEACWDEARRCGACGGRRRLRRPRARVATGEGPAPRILAAGVALMLVVLATALGVNHAITSVRAQARLEADAARAQAEAERARARQEAERETEARREAELRARDEARAARAAREALDLEVDRDWAARFAAEEEQARLDAAAAQERERVAEQRRFVRQRVRALNDDAARFLDDGRLDDAVRTYRASAAVDDTNLTTLTNLAIVLVRQGAFDEAARACDQVLALDPKHVEAWVTRANALALDGQPEAARADLDRALAIHPTHATALSNRGAVWLQLKDPAAAEADACAALRARPGDPHALLTRARARALQGEIEGALGDCEALASSPFATPEQRTAAAAIVRGSP